MIRFDHPSVNLTEKQKLAWKGYEVIYPAKIFLPTRPQADFAEAIGNCLQTGHRIFAVDSGNGTGKTTGLENILLNIIDGRINIYPYAKDLNDGKEFPDGFFAGDLYTKWPKKWPKKVWYISDGDVLKETIEELEKWAQPGSYVKRSEGKVKHPGAVVFKETTENKDDYDILSMKDWQISFKTLDQKRTAFQGANVGIVVIDERCHEWQYDAVVRRLRSGGILIHTATPVGDTQYFYDKIVDKVGQDSDKWHQRVSLFSNAISGSWTHGIYTEEENPEKAGEPIVYECGGVWDLGDFGVHPKGNLTEFDVTFQLNNVDDAEFDSIILGKPTHQRGAIWPTYSINRNEIMQYLHWEDMNNYPEIRMIIDPHDAYPPAVLWVRIDKFGRRYYFREWPSVKDSTYGGKLFHEIDSIGNYDLKDFSEFFIEIEKEWKLPYKKIRRIMDPNFGLKPSSVPGVQVYHAEYTKASREVYERLGMHDKQFNFYMKANDSLPFGHQKVRDALKKTVSNDYYITVSPDCVNLDLALRKYKRTNVNPNYEDIHGPAKENAKGVEVEKKYKAFADLIRYDLVVPLTSVSTGERDERAADDYGADKYKLRARRPSNRMVGIDDLPEDEPSPYY